MGGSLKVYFRIIIAGIILVLLCFSNILNAQEIAKHKIHINKSQQYDDRKLKKSSVNVSIKNVSPEEIFTPIKAVIENIDIPDVTVINADGLTSDGKPYFDYSALVGSDNVLSPNETSGIKMWIFDNPLDDKFTYSVNIVSAQSNEDTTPPIIIITNPVSNSVISHDTPYITIGFRDEGSGVDLISLMVEIDGVDQTANFGMTSNYAMYHLPSGLSNGNHEIIVSLCDMAGNVNIYVSNFTVQASPSPCTYLFSLKGNPWIFASPGDGTYTEYLSPDTLGISEDSDLVSLSKPTLFEGIFFSFLQGGIYQSSENGSYGLYKNNSQLGLSESVRLNALDVGFIGDPIFFCALGYGGIYQTMGTGTYDTYLSNTQLGISRDAVIDALDKDYRNALYFHITGQSGVYEHSNGTNTLFLTEDDLGVPGSALDGFDILPEQVQPVITISSPASGSSLSTATPGMVASFNDADSGIAPSTFKALLDGADVTSFFGVTGTGASWQVPSTSPLVGVNHTLNVSISDRVGNQASAVSQFAVGVNLPPTVSITANPTEITGGDSTVLTWTSSYADSVSIDNGIGPVVPNGSVTVSPEETTTYTITASGANGTATDSVTVAVTQTLRVRLSAQPQTIMEGEASILSWTSILAESASLDNGIGSVAVNGLLNVSPLQTTTYTITVQGQGSTANSSVTVTVLHRPSVTLTAMPDAIPEGGTTTLSWSSSNAISATIDNGIGSVALSGTMQIRPSANTIYTITVTGDGGLTSSASALVTVHSKPVVNFTANPVEIFQGESSTLSWSCTNADSVSIDNGIGSVGQVGTLTVSPANTITYTLTATGPGGTTTKTATITVHSIISLTITSPENGSVVDRPDILVRGSVTNMYGHETGVTVNGVPALIYGSQFAVNHVPLLPGDNTITVVGLDSNGHTTELSMTVRSEVTRPYVTLSIDEGVGCLPFESTLRLQSFFSPQSLSMSDTGLGAIQYIVGSDLSEIGLQISSQGMFFITVQTQLSGENFSDTIAVLVYSQSTLDSLLRQKWEGMSTALLNNDLDAAVKDISVENRDSVQRAIRVTEPEQRARLVNELGDIQLIKTMGSSAEYDIQTVRNGTLYSFYLLFKLDDDGMWKISRF